MVIDAILDWVFAGLQWLVSLLPQVAFDCSTLSGMSSYLSWVGGYVDLPTISMVLAFVVGTELTIWVVSFFVWLYNKIPLT